MRVLLLVKKEAFIQSHAVKPPSAQHASESTPPLHASSRPSEHWITGSHGNLRLIWEELEPDFSQKIQLVFVSIQLYRVYLTAKMGFPGSLRVFVLVCLLAVGFRSLEADNVNTETLARIIQFFDDNYKKVEKNVRQYAVAINVPEDQCKINFVPDKNNFLTKEESSTNVINKIYDENVALYEGQELIAAGTLKKQKHTRHSESILMNPPESSPMTNLLNKKKDGCVVFYTYNSPCVQTCIDINGNYSILKMLERWSKQGGLKAFVFKDIWKFDQKKDLKENFKAITKYVPLYRCVSSETCYECVEGDNINLNCVQ
ncbi:hypothetical protein AMEX_G17090 [Astyanax mexicanus]|uniref:Uncharacterized protein n=2 Tax=Astyanax mexicanus TaxID=7994 RepID=A0A8T2L855_ASTMX|nr:hypothetical protein AMEX_G17090 [Astyanax mexicanus]